MGQKVDHVGLDKRLEIEALLEIAGDRDAIFFEGFDDAIVGLGTQQYKGPYVIYDRDKCLQILVERDGMTYDEAEEFFSFNTEGCWAGDRTPVILVQLNERE
jgi:hypothetical protein